MERYIDENKKWWDEIAEINFNSKMYNVKEFIDGKISLLPIIVEETKNLFKDKKILHLQCHFGMDSISLVRNGAKEVTGIDFSDNAIKYANYLKEQIGMEHVNFIQSDIYKLDEVLTEKYDVVFTSLGVLEWLYDLDKWGYMIQKHLKSGGIFYIFDYHPMALVFSRESRVNEFKVTHSYFKEDMPYRLINGSAYSNTSIKLKNIANEWQHSISELLNSLISNNLKLVSMKEYPFIDYMKFPFMEKMEDKQYWYAKGYNLPYMFSLLMKKEEEECENSRN